MRSQIHIGMDEMQEVVQQVRYRFSVIDKVYKIGDKMKCKKLVAKLTRQAQIIVLYQITV